MCGRADGVLCAYVDSRGRSCATDWCPDHVLTIDGLPYCRRHAGIVATLGTSAEAEHLPDVDNRAHSLANWVGNDLDEGIRGMLGQALRGDETLVVEPILYVFTVFRTHLWERSWKLVNPGGGVLKVSVDVDEANDAEVRMRLGKRTIMSAVPPWIERRYNPHRFANDAQSRREFYALLLSSVQEAVDLQRQS
jgi:hypothetical protein